MSPGWVSLLLGTYFFVVLLIARFAGRGAGHRAFFESNRGAHWGVIAFGMLGVSLSGISFVSVPGMVLTQGFLYMQMVLGYIVGYYVIAHVLLPVYYRLGVPSIYAYLGMRLGAVSHRTGATLFLLSRLTIASLRLYVVSSVLHGLVFQHWGVPFVLTVLLTLGLIWLYTHRAGIQAIVWTDLFQTLVMLLSLLLTLWLVLDALGMRFWEAVDAVRSSGYAQLVEWSDWNSPHHFVKLFLAGAFIPIVMTGLDQDMMQKNLACRTLGEAKRNMVSYGYGFLPINLLLLGLGALMALYVGKLGVSLPTRGDELYPMVATGGYLGSGIGLLFVLGIIAATFSSADSALTALTTSFTLDILGVPLDSGARVRKVSALVHGALALLMVLCILALRWLGTASAISTLFSAVGYTYGPLLGLFGFSLFTRWQSREVWVPALSVLAPLASYGCKVGLQAWLGYSMGYELLLLNGLLMFAGLWLTRRRGCKVAVGVC